MMPSTTLAGRREQRQQRPTAAAPPAASGRSLRLRSAKRAAPQIATEKTTVTPTPATSEATTVSSSSLVSTTSPDHPLELAGTGAPCWARRAKAATISESAIRVTSTGPSAPVPKIRVRP